MNVYLYIACMAGITYLIRVLPLTLIRKEIQNVTLRSFLYYVPYVTLAVMTFPAILHATQSPIAGAIALIVGIILVMFIKKGSSKNVGMICIGFGVLFTGLMAMTDAVEPLAESQAFVDAMAYFSDMPMLGILTGLVLTVIIQSSSAMVGILQALSVTGQIRIKCHFHHTNAATIQSPNCLLKGFSRNLAKYRHKLSIFHFSC